jgi:phage-related minor tail protein
MTMQLPTSDQTNAALRHIYTAVGTGVAVALFFGVSPDMAAKIAPAVHQIGDGFASIIAGVTALIPVATALYAAWTASPFSKLMAAKNNPEIKQVVTVAGTPTAALADQIPGTKITSG